MDSLPLQWGSRSSGDFAFCGLQITVRMPYITLDQKAHCMNLSTIAVPSHRARCPSSPVTELERNSLRKCLGEQIWAVDQTVPTGSFHVSAIASKVQSATVATLLECNKNARRIRNEPVVLNFGPMSKHICVYSFGDSSKSKPPQRGMATFIGEIVWGNKPVV